MIDSGLYHSSISAARDRGASNAIEIPTLLPQLEAGCFEALVKKLMAPSGLAEWSPTKLPKKPNKKSSKKCSHVKIEQF